MDRRYALAASSNRPVDASQIVSGTVALEAAIHARKVPGRLQGPQFFIGAGSLGQASKRFEEDCLLEAQLDVVGKLLQSLEARLPRSDRPAELLVTRTKQGIRLAQVRIVIARATDTLPEECYGFLIVCSISWFMRLLCQKIARMANDQDGVRGKFWEARFKCQPLLDDQAVLTCSMYVNLNPIRAGKVRTPEESRFTSVYERIIALKRAREARSHPAHRRWIAGVRQSAPALTP
jgi:hypothetical protein